MKKRIVCCILAIFMVAVLLPFPCVAAPSQKPDISGAKSVLLYNLDSSDIILSKESDQKVHPAATVKMMVALIAIDYFQNQETGLDTAITVPAEVIRESQGLTMELRKNEIPVRI